MLNLRLENKKYSTMKKFLLFKAVIALILLLTMAIPSSIAQKSDQHMLWKVESDGQVQGYLVGSVHLMKSGIYPLDDVYQQAFNKSEVVVFELNFDSLRANMMGLLRRLAFYPQDKSIKGALSKNTYTLLQNTLDSLGLPAARFNRLEPWYIAISVPALQMRQAGYTGKAGIDLHFFSKAKKTDKEIVGLETAAYQLNIFDDLPPGLQEKYLKYSLKQADKTLMMIDEMITAWKSGNADKIEQIMQGEMKNNFSLLYQKLLIVRNKNWIPKIETLLSQDDTPMIIVGAGHMTGEKGLISLLEQQGYKVEQL